LADFVVDSRIIIRQQVDKRRFSALGQLFGFNGSSKTHLSGSFSSRAKKVLDFNQETSQKATFLS